MMTDLDTLYQLIVPSQIHIRIQSIVCQADLAHDQGTELIVSIDL